MNTLDTQYQRYMMIKSFLSKSECDNILNKYLHELDLKPAEATLGEVGKTGVDLKMRKSSTAFIDNIDFLDDKLKEVLKNNIHIKGYNLTGLGPYQFTEYKVGEYYNWHTDSDENEYKHRYCSIVIELNNEYDGGLLQLKDNNDIYTFERGIGNLYIFFSNILHRVVPVKTGVRYSLVNWISLENDNGYKKTLL